MSARTVSDLRDLRWSADYREARNMGFSQADARDEADRRAEARFPVPAPEDVPARGDLVHDTDRNRTGVVVRSGTYVDGRPFVDVRFPRLRGTVRQTLRYGADSSRDLRALRVLDDV